MKQIEEITEALERFTLELPDPNEELVVQPRVHQTFPQFKKLPPELRLMIWWATFPPGRLVPVEFIAICKIWTRKHKGSLGLPVTYHINFESREESERVYSTLHPDEASQSDIYYTMCVSMTRDFIHMAESTIFMRRPLTKKVPGNWAKLEHLVLQLEALESLEKVGEKMFLFSGLKTLKFIQPKDSWFEDDFATLRARNWYETKWPEEAEASKDFLLRMMAAWKEEHPGRTVPELYMLPFEKITKRLWRKA